MIKHGMTPRIVSWKSIMIYVNCNASRQPNWVYMEKKSIPIQEEIVEVLYNLVIYTTSEKYVITMITITIKHSSETINLNKQIKTPTSTNTRLEANGGH